jgi:deferrochelatase/peroxidase EfeB
VHAVILLYDVDDAALRQGIDRVRVSLAGSGVVVTHHLDLVFNPVDGDPAVGRENFGFADSISQPLPWGPGIVGADGVSFPRHPIHGVAAGDLLLGHLNAFGEPAPGPVVPETLPCPPAARNLGLNGSYLVIRELSQDRDAFWASMESAAASIGAPSATWLAEHVVGRGIDGTALVPGARGLENNFLFGPSDTIGGQCPAGAHIRRGNPRDSLAPTAAGKAASLQAVNNHRILRRGRKYRAYTLPAASKPLPGILFMCLNTDIERQFEFLQETWMFSPGFAARVGERDPLLAGGPMTLPAGAARLRPQVESAIRFVGGEYFFLPGLPALRYLSSLP